jgi:predicted RNA-binding protein YlxR (DUF448 family)
MAEATQRRDQSPPAPPAEDREGPERRCLASGGTHPKAELLRFVVDPEGRVVFDLEGRLPGRGLWLLPRRTMLDRAARRKLFQRAARQPVEVPEDLAERVAGQLRQRCIDTLGLANRAGQAVAGFEKVRARLRAGEAAVLLAASDGGADGRRKLAKLARAVSPEADIVDVLSAEEMGAALGRAPCVHAALLRGGLARRFREAATTLAAFEERDDGPAAPAPS